MKELKEISVGDQEISISESVVKTSILPQTTKELSRNIKIQGDSVFEGSVFGNDIEISGGNVEFQKSVYADSELHILSDIEDAIQFNEAVAASDSIAAFMTQGGVIFGGDVNAPSIRLKNCFVAGSVFGSNVYVENCVVLGGIFSAKEATISNCLFGTFNAPAVELSGINYMMYPAAFSVEPLNALPGTELYNISLAHLGAIFKGEPQMAGTGKIKIDFQTDGQRTVLADEQGTTTTVNSYSVSGRVLAADVLDLDKLENHFLIGAGALNTQVLKAYSLQKADGSRSEELTLDNIANFFFDILSGEAEIQDVAGEISFSELKKSFE